MTGFGKAQASYNDKIISIEIKSLNSKQIDINLKSPSKYRNIDISLRSLISLLLERGKVDCFIIEENSPFSSSIRINTELFRNYYQELSSLADMVNAPKDDIFRLVLQNQEITRPVPQETDKEEEDFIKELLIQSIEKINEFRIQEGLALEKDLRLRIGLIDKNLEEVNKFENKRILVIKDRIKQRLEEVFNSNIDSNRLEQELIFYLEKLDITEEKIRLKQHLDYFIQTLELPTSQGKKLGFVSQEIGREINTLGSKANEANMQKLVVEMKDELEKIKEQLLNVL